ncbi:MAG: esterase/lipase family protein [Candidatus Thorarchaeota archaeon]
MSTDIAVRTLLDEVASTKLNIKETTLARLESVPLFIDLLVLVGHGKAEGLETPKALVPWSELYNDISERQAQMTIVLACSSPSDQSSNIVGFDSRVDAEAGAIIVGWYIQQTITKQSESVFPFDRVARAQKSMQHPLERYLYFVNGYWGDDDQFDAMVTYLDTETDTFDLEYDVDNIRYFNYFDYYGAVTEALKIIVHNYFSISAYANNFYTHLHSLPPGTQVNIIAHSMGGLIVREMLRLHRTDLNDDEIDIGKVITLGTPNDGTWLADPTNVWSVIASLIGGYLPPAPHLWPSMVFWSMTPETSLIDALNSNPQSYSYDIDWYTVSGYYFGLSELMYYIHGDISDPIVARGRAHLSFATDTEDFSIGHNELIKNESILDSVSEWIMEGVDTDGDGLTDDAEIYYYYTNPNNGNTDGDAVGDKNEILWGYDPLDSNDPIPQTSLISSVSYTSSTRYVRVYVNHYPDMNYVKFYVKYKSKYGWTGYYYMGTDYTPSSGKYYDSWTHPTGYFKMIIKVNAFDPYDHYIGTAEHPEMTIGDGGEPPEH